MCVIVCVCCSGSKESFSRIDLSSECSAGQRLGRGRCQKHILNESLINRHI